ncbi:MAG: MBOAT family O-acyltransferase, partial [Eubacteriales bacterium]|nr:MBOAT family O-acyltransferase [Eubacteriales bacterium]
LFVASLIFYAFGEPIYIALMLVSITINYGLAYPIDWARREQRRALKIFFVTLTLIVNIGALAFFKYSGFFVENLQHLLQRDLDFQAPALPIGISFYTFQILSYVIDVARGHVDLERNYINLACYVSMFPQLIAGPIVRFKTVAQELHFRKESFYDIERGITRFVYGLAQKALLANPIGELWDRIQAYPMETLSTPMAWLGLVAFAFQIYFDFAAYSNMAIGLGAIFGFHFLENFRDPYTATSITDFWRRWHISLSSWFKSYVYIPLGGNRRGIVRQIFNIIVVWLLTGFWHGANWNFILWGLYFAVLLILEKIFLLRLLKKSGPILARIYTLFLVLISWAIFAIDDLAKLRSYLTRLFIPVHPLPLHSVLYGEHGRYGLQRHFSGDLLYLLGSYAILLILCILFSTPYPRRFLQRLDDPKSCRSLAGLRRQRIVKDVVVLILWFFSVASIVSAAYNPFLYFRF